MVINEEQLKKYIVDSGLVSKSDLADAFKLAEEKKQKIGEVLLSLAGVLLGAGLVIWAATDFNGEKLIITTVGSWIRTILTEPIGG